MAGHSQFKNIMHRKGAQDAKRAKLFTKLIREIITAARTGQPDPAFNSRLRTAINTARSLNLPKDKIDNAIKRGSTPSDGENYDEIRYEGFAPGGIAIIVEALTDNRNRTASEVRSSFTKYGGALGETGSVSFMFEKVGIIEYPTGIASYDTIFELAIEADAKSCENDENFYHIICGPEQLHNIRDIFVQKFGEPNMANLTWRPLNTVSVEEEHAEKLIKLIEVLEDNDDVQNVYANYQLSNEIMDKLLK